MSVTINTTALKVRESTNDSFQSKSIVTAADNTSIADRFNSSSTYAVGDLVIYNGGLWKCHTAISTAGEWTGITNWAQTNVSTELASFSPEGGASDEVIISDTQPTDTNNKLWVKETSSSDGVSIPTMADIGVIESTLNSKADQSDLASLNLTGTTNTTGNQIYAGTYFYLNGVLIRAKVDIASGATFTSGTNYEAVTAGGLNAFVPKSFPCTYNSTYFENVDKNFYIKCGNVVQVYFVAQIKEAIPNNTNAITNLPTSFIGAIRVVPVIGNDKYMANPTLANVATANSGIIQTTLGSSFVGKWIMYSFTYICY